MANQVIDSVLNDLMQAQSSLRQKAEAEAAAARLSLMRATQILAADWLEALSRQNKTPDIQAMADIVTERAAALGALLNRCQNVEKIQAIERENAELRASKDALIRERDSLRAQLKSLQNAFESGKRTNQPTSPEISNGARQEKIINPKRTIAHTENNYQPATETKATTFDNRFPEWFRRWESESDQWSKEALRLIGEGLVFRKDIAAALTELKGVSPSNTSTVNAALKSLSDAGLIEVQELPREGPVNPGHIVRLKRLGEEAYQIIFNKEPVRNDFDALRSVSSSDAHTALIVKAIKHLRADGWEVDGQVELILGRGSYKPDIAGVINGQACYFEVERHTNKSERNTKWHNASEANRGNIFVFAENESAVKALQAEINRSLGASLDNTNVFISNLQMLERGERAPDGNLWHKKSIRNANFLPTFET